MRDRYQPPRSYSHTAGGHTSAHHLQLTPRPTQYAPLPLHCASHFVVSGWLTCSRYYSKGGFQDSMPHVYAPDNSRSHSHGGYVSLADPRQTLHVPAEGV